MATILDIDLTNSPGNSYDFFSNKKCMLVQLRLKI